MDELSEVLSLCFPTHLDRLQSCEAPPPGVSQKKCTRVLKKSTQLYFSLPTSPLMITYMGMMLFALHQDYITMGIILG